MIKEHKDYYYAIPNSFTYTYPLDDTVEDPSCYRELIQLLRNATEVDTVIIDINNYGGHLTTCVAIVNAIRSCRAVTIGNLTSVAYSAAGAIWLACSHQTVGNHVGFMAHDAQSGNYGSLYQQKQHISHDMEILRSLYNDVYKYFLTQEEIDGMLKNGDLWLNEYEILERLKNRSELLDKDTKDHIDKAFSEAIEQSKIPDKVLSKMTKKQIIDVFVNGTHDLDKDWNIIELDID